MKNDQWEKIYDKIKKNYPSYGSMIVKLYYHDKKLVKYEISKTETTLIIEGDNKIKESTLGE